MPRILLSTVVLSCWMFSVISSRALALSTLKTRHHDVRRVVFSVAAASVTGNVDETAVFAVDTSRPFQVVSDYQPAGDQPLAIQALQRQLLVEKHKYAVLHGSTGTGKTFVMSHLIASGGKPTLLLCHNKTLAAQLARELRSFLPHNAVHLFVSYYDTFTPECYLESSGKYLEKKSSINPHIDILRHRATKAILTRRDTVIVSSVSSIYGLGFPKEYFAASTAIEVGGSINVADFMERLNEMRYRLQHNDNTFRRGEYQTSHDNNTKKTKISIWCSDEKCPMIVKIQETDKHENGRVVAIEQGNEKGLTPLSFARIFPARHHIVPRERLLQACQSIREEMEQRFQELMEQGKSIEAERLQQRTLKDLSLIAEFGFCKGGENYSRHFAGRAPGETPDTLLDYFQWHDDWLLIVDESHVTLPQLKAMYVGDRSRKEKLIKHGYRLPSAFDHRPLMESEFWQKVKQALFVSATPAQNELALAEGEPIKMEIRPTFVCDPEIEVRPTEGQLDDILNEVRLRITKKQRTLILTLTKRDAEDLSSYLLDHDIASTYIHSGLSTDERSDTIKSLQLGENHCLVGVNCLREGIDLPEVSLVVILDACSQGFLRSEASLLQIVGRAARHVDGKAIFYATRVTESMRRCIDSTTQRRQRQLAYNEEHKKEMKSTTGSSMLSIFNLLEDEIQEELSNDKVSEISEQNSSSDKIPSTLTQFPITGKTTHSEIITDHIPNSPGVYYWRDSSGVFLYIGKAVNLRSRVRSYLLPKAKHSDRIILMLQRAVTVDFLLTQSARDALILESKLIKHHQPLFNVLLKDDGHYPYIQASVGDHLPSFSIVPRPQEATVSNKQYRYFGPYTSFRDIQSMLEAIEEKYQLRENAFLVRHGSRSREEYLKFFDLALADLCNGTENDKTLLQLRSEYEEANLLFESPYNVCRDVISVYKLENDDNSAIVHVIQLRNGVVAGQFSYDVTLPYGFENDRDFADAIKVVLQQIHYPSGQESFDNRFSWFPDEILVSHKLNATRELLSAIRKARALVEPERDGKIEISAVSDREPRKSVDIRAIKFATENARHAALKRSQDFQGNGMSMPADETAARDIARMLSLPKTPRTIECYDISHTQGKMTVASRVVFFDGKPRKDLYRKFIIRTVDGINDYASIEEVLQRRFHRLVEDDDDPWSMPDLILIDGGKGQLNVAVRTLQGFDIDVSFNEQSNRRFLPVCALAKENEDLFVPGNPQPVNDSPDSPALLLLRAVRDESHRFALDFHRHRRSITRSS